MNLNIGQLQSEVEGNLLCLGSEGGTNNIGLLRKATFLKRNLSGRRERFEQLKQLLIPFLDRNVIKTFMIYIIIFNLIFFNLIN